MQQRNNLRGFKRCRLCCKFAARKIFTKSPSKSKIRKQWCSKDY